MSESFLLDPRLAEDCFVLGDSVLCRLLLMNDARFPWFILVPRRVGATEMHALDEADRLLLARESAALAAAMEQAFLPDSLNVAKLGNIVAQLHLHHVARHRHDAAWPGPVWGRAGREPYADDGWREPVRRLHGCLDLPLDWRANLFRS